MVRSCSFDLILENYPSFRKVDLLSVDVEGHEEEVFKSLTSKKFQAKIIIVESDKSKTVDLLKLPALQKYVSVFSNGINTILINDKYSLPYIKELPVGFSRINN